MNLFWKEKKLKTVWKVEKNGHSGLLVGTAHFCPYHFEKALKRLIGNAEIILFEGPLDQESMKRVVQYGRQGEGTPSLYEALSPAATAEINKRLGTRLNTNTTAGSYLELIQRSPENLLEAYTRGVRPWMAFFMIWSALLNWHYSMDVEAYRIAKKLGKRIDFLETIEDQLDAMDGIPFERFVNYLNNIEHWKDYQDQFMKAFLSGNLEKFFSLTGVFPTRCESILARRDPLFFRGIKAHMEEGLTVAFVGVAHIPGILKLFIENQYQVRQETT